MNSPARTATAPDRSETPRSLSEILKICYFNPVLFNEVVLGRPPCWARQVEICRSVVRYRDTVVCSGNATGKSWMAAGLILWYLYTRPNSLVVVTGPSQTSIGSVTFKEVRRALSQARYELPGRITKSPQVSPQSLEIRPGWSTLGVSTTSVERLSGQHAHDLFVVVDEASGVDEEIYQAIDSLNYSRLLAIGNPLRAEGRFYELWQQGERESRDPALAAGQRVNAIRIPSTESPHIDLERSPVGLADLNWLGAMGRRYGTHSVWWRTHVQALFPDAAADGLIPAEWLDRCTSAARRGGEAGPRRIACDLGEGVGRDRTVLLVRDDLGVLELVADRAMGLPEAAAEIVRLARAWGVPETRISYDAAGIGRDLRHHLERYGITQARAYHGAGGVKTNFTNLRTASAWQLRRRLDPSYPGDPFAIPAAPWWPALRTELLALHYDLVTGKTRLEAKETLKARLGQSPDLADALIQSFSYD